MSLSCVFIENLRFYFIPDVLEEFDSFLKGVSFANHGDINGIKVFLTAKAPGQVRFLICSGMKLGAYGAEKSEVPIDHFGWYAQDIGDDHANRDVVSELIEFFFGKHDDLSGEKGFRDGLIDQGLGHSLLTLSCGI